MYKAAAPTLDELNPLTRERIAHHIRLYKEFMRPMLLSARVFHHTPVLPMTQPNDWYVIEYVAEHAERAYVGLFRLSGAGSDVFELRPRGLDEAVATACVSKTRTRHSRWTAQSS